MIPEEMKNGSTLAWFNLAEFVARGEKERALSIYKLMLYSWRDEAYAAQLKGDLLYSFQEYERAYESYLLAISLYDSSQRYCYGTFIYEALLKAQGPSFLLLKTLIQRYALAGDENRVQYYTQLCMQEVPSLPRHSPIDVMIENSKNTLHTPLSF